MSSSAINAPEICHRTAPRILTPVSRMKFARSSPKRSPGRSPTRSIRKNGATWMVSRPARHSYQWGNRYLLPPILSRQDRKDCRYDRTQAHPVESLFHRNGESHHRKDRRTRFLRNSLKLYGPSGPLTNEAT